jgi:hypothetical protein
MNHDILRQLLVVPILGPGYYTQVLCSGIHSREGIHSVAMPPVTADYGKGPKADRWAIAMFMRHAADALEAGKHTLVITDFPKCYPDAVELQHICPNLFAMSLEENISIRLQRFHSHSELSRGEFKRRLEREENELPTLKNILQREGPVPVIYGIRGPVSTKQYMISCITGFRQRNMAPSQNDLAVA